MLITCLKYRHVNFTNMLRSVKNLNVRHAACASWKKNVPNPVQYRNRKPRLARIDFPRMDVESRRLGSSARLKKSTTDYRERKLAQIPTACRGYGITQNARRCEREFCEAPGRPLNDVRSARRVRITVTASPNGKEARVVSVAFLDQDVEGPLATWNDRKTGRPVTEDFPANQVFECVFRCPDIFTKGFSVERGHAFVPKTVGSDFVPGCGDVPHNLRTVLRDPAQHEECAARAVSIESGEQGVDAAPEPART